MAVNGLGEVEMGDFDFMNNPNFGAPGGVIANQAAQQNDLAMQSQRNQLAVQPQMLMAQLSKTQNEAGKLGAETSILNFQNQRNQIFAQKLQQLGLDTNGPDGKPMSMSGMLGQVAIAAQQSGSPEAMAHYSSLAASMAGHDAAMMAAQARMKRAQLLADNSDMQKFAGQVSQATSWDDLDKIAAPYSAQHNGAPPPWANIPRSTPVSVVQQIVDQGVMTAKQRQDEQFKTQQAADKAASTRQGNELKMMQQEIKAYDDRKKAELAILRLKQGGKNTEPTATDIGRVSDLVKQDNPDLVGTDAEKKFSVSVALDVKKAMQANPALDPEVETFNAYQKRKGDLVIDKKPPTTVPDNVPLIGGAAVPGTGGKPTATFNNSKLGTKQTPLPFQPDASKRIEGRFYNTPNGTPHEWNKQGWVAQ